MRRVLSVLTSASPSALGRIPSFPRRRESSNTDSCAWRTYIVTGSPPQAGRWQRILGMNINGKHYRTIWLNDDGWSVEIIDQTKLPFVLETVILRDLDDAAGAIKSMQVRGAPLIGATAA